MILNARSEKALAGVHPDLVRVVRRAAAITDLEFIVTEGLRSAADQAAAVARGASTTRHSRHLTGCAVDIVAIINGKPIWDMGLATRLSVVMKQAATDLSIPLEWGGDWRTFKDGPHFQLPWKQYP